MKRASQQNLTYHSYYNLIVKAKDYQSEVAFIDALIQEHAPCAHDVLDVGCGTGSHDFLLAQKGYTVTGVEYIDELIQCANERLANEPPPLKSKVSFRREDARSMRLGRHFDVIIAMYNVMGYMTSNEDIVAFLTTIRRHLRPGGLFICDCWHGAAFLNDPPCIRIRKGGDSKTAILHIAEPTLKVLQDTVEVTYTLIVRDTELNRTQQFNETIAYRFFFIPELRFLFSRAGLFIGDIMEFMSKGSVEIGTREICIVARSKKKQPMLMRQSSN